MNKYYRLKIALNNQKKGLNVKKIAKFDTELKNKRNTLCLFNLILFLGSFLMISITSFSNSSKNSDSFHISQHLSDKKNISDSSSQLLIEENSNENETENAFELQAIFIPFLISCLSTDSLELPLISVAPLTEKLTNPIYLSVCNFRI